MFALLAALILAAAGDARAAKKPTRDPRTVGLGKSCKKNSDCKHGSQRCVGQSDAKGKVLDKAFCVLPCASFEAGLPKVTPYMPAEPAKKTTTKKKPPARCPASYECRSAGSGVPIDMCVKQ
jgi:hypothetical protein